MRHDAGLFVVVVHGVRPHHQGACACGRHAVDFDHGSVIVGKCIIASSARKSIIIMLARAMLARAMPAKAMPAKAKHANAMLGRAMPAKAMHANAMLARAMSAKARSVTEMLARAMAALCRMHNYVFDIMP